MRNQSVAETITGEEMLRSDTGSMLFRSSVCQTLVTYLLTSWSRVLLEKLTGSAASQEIPRLFGTRRFLTVLTSARHPYLS